MNGLRGGQGRSAGSVERDALGFGVIAALGALLLGLAFLLGGCSVAEKTATFCNPERAGR